MNDRGSIRGAQGTRRRTEEALLPDTHAHLDDACFEGDIDELVSRAETAGVGPILAVGTNLASSTRASELARRYTNVYAAGGVHPHEASHFEEEAEGVRAMLDAPEVVSVGEIGLDYHRGRANAGEQLAAFRTQLRWAAERQLPVSVHNRDADEDVLSCLAEAGVDVVLHCFSGDAALAAEALERGYYISFAGNLTFPRAEGLRALARDVPQGRLLTESDAPVLAPQPWRGRRNEPSYIRATVQALASARGESVAALEAALSDNAARLFHWTPA